MPKAPITGITGQDGSYLADFLLEQGYDVIGLVRRTSTVNLDRIRHIHERIVIAQGDLLDQMSLINPAFFQSGTGSESSKPAEASL